MQWFSGNIGQAIQTAKASQGIFLVVVHGDPETDATSAGLLQLFESDDVTSRLSLQSTPAFVAIKILAETETYKQFSQLYPVVLLPSLYFINSTTGVDLEVTGGPITKEKLLESINKAVKKLYELSNFPGPSFTPQGAQSLPVPSSGLSSADDVLSPRGMRVEQARATLRESVSSNVENGQASSSAENSLTMEERVEKAKRLLAERQAQKAREEEEEQKRKEQERREVGKSLTDMKRERDEAEMVKAAEERKRDKENDRLALEKIREQIARDREEKAARFDTEKQAALDAKAKKEKEMKEKEVEEAARMAAERSHSARVQVRYPDGRSRTQTFPADAPLQHLYDFVNEEMETVFGKDNFNLNTTFPVRQLNQESRDAQLRVVGLAPSGTVLVIPKGRSSGGGLANPGSFISYLWFVFTPITFLYGLIMSFFTMGPSTPQGVAPQGGPTAAERTIADQRARAAEKRQAEASQQAGGSSSKRPSTAYQRHEGAGIRRDGNIARLGEENDSDEENNTYNGNSTQQM